MSDQFGVTALAPVLMVDDVASAVAFWSDALGFTRENEVSAESGGLTFASVKKGSVEIMYQSKASVIAEAPGAAADLVGHTTGLFITVPSIDDLDTIERLTSAMEVVKPRHTTFYGTTEFYIREPGGNVVGFATHTG